MKGGADSPLSYNGHGQVRFQWCRVPLGGCILHFHDFMAAACRQIYNIYLSRVSRGRCISRYAILLSTRVGVPNTGVNYFVMYLFGSYSILMSK